MKDIHTMNKLVAEAIVEEFDSFLEERNVKIPTSYEAMIEDGRTQEDCNMRLYGPDYFELEDKVADILRELEKSFLTGIIDELAIRAKELGMLKE